MQLRLGRKEAAYRNIGETVFSLPKVEHYESLVAVMQRYRLSVHLKGGLRVRDCVENLQPHTEFSNRPVDK